MLIIGLTGGIGSGKSTVARRFEALGVPVIDADAIARQLVAPGEPALRDIAAVFGAHVITSAGELDRAQLRARVFANPDERQALEAILHPKVRGEIQRRIAALSAEYCILSIPLLIESGWQDSVQRVLVVDCPAAVQLERAAQRDGASRANIQAIMDNQVDRQTRLAAADDVITNDGSLAALHAQVDALHQRYRALASERAQN
jgi:dephospho-CoA kinase